jgi:glycosyltransferase involved in cell wall biosynthesis
MLRCDDAAIGPREAATRPLRISIIGSRGYPSSYGGFETLVRVLAPYLADRGHSVTVYSRPDLLPTEDADRRVEVSVTRGLNSSSLSTLSHGLAATLRARSAKPDVALVLNIANGLYLSALRRRGIPTVVNVDGLEWTRDKWGPLAKRMFLLGARSTARHATEIVVDSRAIGEYWNSVYDRGSHFIPYGGDTYDTTHVSVDQLRAAGVRSSLHGYCLVVCRLVPENSLRFLFEVIRACRAPSVIVGDFPTSADPNRRRLQDLLVERPDVTWLGHVRDQQLLWSLRRFAGAYLHGHRAGGTNPGLLEAMHAGVPVIAARTPFNEEVLGSSGVYFDDRTDPGQTARLVEELCDDREHRDRIAVPQHSRLAPTYEWRHVCAEYDRLLDQTVQRQTGRF